MRVKVATVALLALFGCANTQVATPTCYMATTTVLRAGTVQCGDVLVVHEPVSSSLANLLSGALGALGAWLAL